MCTLMPSGRFAKQFTLKASARLGLPMVETAGADNFLGSAITANQRTSCFKAAGGDHTWRFAYDDQTPETGDAMQDFG
jgi:hypothetical protein